MPRYDGSTLSGSGFDKARYSLNTYIEYPMKLERERRRFSVTPPIYKSFSSGTPTRSASPATEEEILRDELYINLRKERNQSGPYNQFEDQQKAEQERIQAEHITEHGFSLLWAEPEAYELVKQRWVEQGIWRDEWTGYPFTVWKHECSLEDLEAREASRSETTSTNGKSSGKRKRPASSEETKQISAERRAKLVRDREASRPFHQFMYQLSQERERLQGASDNTAASFDSNINSVAYDNVRKLWESRKIWDDFWGTMPGMIWKHEKPEETELERVYREHGVWEGFIEPKKPADFVEKETSQPTSPQQETRPSRKKSAQADEQATYEAAEDSQTASRRSKASKPATAKNPRERKQQETPAPATNGHLPVVETRSVRKSPRLQEQPTSTARATVSKKASSKKTAPSTKRRAAPESPAAKPSGVSKTQSSRSTRQSKK